MFRLQNGSPYAAVFAQWIYEQICRRRRPLPGLQLCPPAFAGYPPWWIGMLCKAGTMSNLKVYGVPGSRAYRVLWMVNELGLDYEHVPVHFGDGSARTPEYLAVNPNARIPAIDDAGFKLWESMAINLYLAKKHDKGFWPKTLE